MKSVVVGLGEFGYAAALALAESGAEVIAIDSEMSIVESIKDHVALAVCLDASNRAALEAHDVASADVLIAAIGHNFEAQVLAVVHASKLGVAHIVARAVTPTHAAILREVGAHEALNPEETAARRLVQKLMIPNVAEYFELSDGFSLVEVAVPPVAVSKTLVELEMRTRFRLNVVGIRQLESEDSGPGSFNPVPRPEDRLSEGELLVLVGSDLDIAHFMAEMGG